MRRGKQIQDLFLDLRDGNDLISLLEMLSGQNLPRERGRMRVHQLQNIQIALNYIKFRKVKLVNIRPEDIVDGNQKLTLGLIWTIILHFQVSSGSVLDIEWHGMGKRMDMVRVSVCPRLYFGLCLYFGSVL